MDKYTTISLNRFHRLSLWCRDCNNYWQSPNYLVVLHGIYDSDMIRRLLKINLYLYNKLFDLDIEACFGLDYNFEEELTSVFDDVKYRLQAQQNEIMILDIDIISSIEQNMSAVVEFVMQVKGSFDMMAQKIIENSTRGFIYKLGVLKKNILRSIESDNIKCAIDNLMDLNIAGLDMLVQCVGIIFNCFYILCVEITEPKVRTPGIMYCEDTSVIVERILNISAQNFLYKYKRRWLHFYREVLTECKSMFGSDLKTYEELRQCGNYETIEGVLYDLFITKNPDMLKQLTILKHIDRYPKNVQDIYDWWSGRSKEQMQRIYNLISDCITMDKKTALLPFILTHKMPAKDRLYYEIFSILRMFDHINTELSNAISVIIRVYPEVFEQVYFPDRERYLTMNGGCIVGGGGGDPLDNIRDKNSLRKCENSKCQSKNKGQNVIWNLNTFEMGKHSMNTIFKEFVKNPRIFDEIFAYAQKNLDVAINANSITRKMKIVYR